MSTSETIELDNGPCPCGTGTIIKYVTSQDNPWSSVDISFGINCPKCKEEWSISHRTLFNKDKERPYKEAYRRQKAIEDQLDEFIAPLIDGYFVAYAAKTMAAEQREMHRLSLRPVDIRRFREGKSRRVPRSELCYPRSNMEWLRKLAFDAGKGSAFDELATTLSEALQDTKEADKHRKLLPI